MTKKQKTKVQNYVNSVRESIKRDYGFIPPEFEAQLGQLEDIYSAYVMASDDFKKQDNLVELINGGKTPVVNMNFQLMRDCMNLMDKLVKNFGLSPLTKQKLKTPNSGSEEEDDYMDSL
jgi:phage terminase small subunit